jgi:hypothetical protein
LSSNIVLTTSNIAEGTNLYFTNARSRSAISLTINSAIAAPSYNASTGVLTLSEILTDKQFTDAALGLRQLRSIEYQTSRMDFGFDKVLDVPYLYYQSGNKKLVNYMDGDGIFVHVDVLGFERKYLREGDIEEVIPNLQQVSTAGSNSTIRLQHNGVNYVKADELPSFTTPSLDQVLNVGRNSTTRAQFNGVDYATFNDLPVVTTPGLPQVLAVQRNSEIRAQFNGVDYATLNDIPSASTPGLPQVLAVQRNSTIRAQFNGVDYATMNDIIAGGTPNLAQVLGVGNNTNGQGIVFGDNGYITTLFGGSLAIFSASQQSGIIINNDAISLVNNNSSGFSISGGNTRISGGVCSFANSTSTTSSLINYAFHQTPALVAGNKYVFLWDGGKFVITNL